MRSSKRMLPPLLQEAIYRPCTLKGCILFWTYNTMSTQFRYTGLRRPIGSRKIMHDTMTSTRPIWSIADTKKAIYNTMATCNEGH